MRYKLGLALPDFANEVQELMQAAWQNSALLSQNDEVMANGWAEVAKRLADIYADLSPVTLRDLGRKGTSS